MAGGTGGHIFPALAIAQKLRDAGARVEWLGSAGGLECDLVPPADITLHQISIKGLRGKGVLSLLFAPWMILRAVLQADKVMGRFKPDCVLGMGGFVTGPGGVAAWLNGIKLLIHEQNAVPGVTNRLLAPLASRIMEAFPETFSRRRRVMLTGNPVRESIIAVGKLERTADAGRPLRILVLGGSQGAVAINQVMTEVMSAWPSNGRPELWHQVGRANLEEARALYASKGLGDESGIRLTGFVDDIAEAFAWADLAVCRSGASTVSELAVAGLPAILVPYPHHKDNQQFLNARWLTDSGAAVVIEQSELDAEALLSALLTLDRDRNELATMSHAAVKRGIDDASTRIAAQCLGVSHGG